MVRTFNPARSNSWHAPQASQHAARWLVTALFITVFSASSFAQVYGIPEPAVPTDRDTVLRVQIFLDNHMFGPGKLDGIVGEFTYKAVINCNFANGARDLYDWRDVLAAAANEVPVIYAGFRIREDLLQHVDPTLPEEPELQAQYPAMAYRSLVELVAERFHTDENFLARINPELHLEALQPGDVVVVPNVRPFQIENIKPQQSFPADPTLSTHTVVIDTTERIAVVYTDDERMLAAFPITPGKPEFIPVGTWTIKTILTMPSFRYDKQFLEEGVRGDQAYQLPPGPNSPIGIIWCGLSKSGIGLHGTASPRTIGRSRSAGCVRFANWDAIRLPQLIRPDTRVIVR